MFRETYRIFKTDKDGKPTRRYWKLVYNAALRLGFALPLDDVINIEFYGEEYPNEKNDQSKHDEFSARFLGNLRLQNKEYEKIVFVHTTRWGRPKFVTFYPYSEHENASESTVEPLIAIALKSEPVSPHEVVNNMHPEFVKNPGIDPIILINNAKNIAESDAKKLLEYAEDWKDKSIAAEKRNENLQEENEHLSSENKKLQQENDKLRAEKQLAAQKGDAVVESKFQILNSVETNIMIANSLNTVLRFEDGSQKTMKVATWDKDLSITKKAQSLIGRKVTTTCWDPISEPGKWSKRDYFRNIYEVE